MGDDIGNVMLAFVKRAGHPITPEDHTGGQVIAGSEIQLRAIRPIDGGPMSIAEQVWWPVAVKIDSKFGVCRERDILTNEGMTGRDQRSPVLRRGKLQGVDCSSPWYAQWGKEKRRETNGAEILRWGKWHGTMQEQC